LFGAWAGFAVVVDVVGVVAIDEDSGWLWVSVTVRPLPQPITSIDRATSIAARLLSTH
jgi:hypothetical protein